LCGISCGYQEDDYEKACDAGVHVWYHR